MSVVWRIAEWIGLLLWALVLIGTVCAATWDYGEWDRWNPAHILTSVNHDSSVIWFSLMLFAPMVFPWLMHLFSRASRSTDGLDAQGRFGVIALLLISAAAFLTFRPDGGL